jgi:hypothetical protein
MLKEKSRKIPTWSKFQKQRREKGEYFSQPKSFELFNMVVSLKKSVVEETTAGKRKNK